MCLNIIIPLGSFYYYFWFIFFMWHIHWDRLVWHWSLEFIRVCVNTLRCHPDTRESRGWNRMWYPGALSSRKKKKKSSPMWPLLRSTTWWMWVLPEDHKFPTHDHVTHWTRDGETLEICCPSLLHLFSIKMTNSPKQHQCQTLKAWSQIYNSARAFTHQTRDVHVCLFFPQCPYIS